MLLAEAAASAASKFNTFDIFMILFTLLILIGTIRLIKQPVKNKFAIGFSIVCLLVFLASDFAMVQNWMS
ncbi:hypothetical protein MUG84_13220 [Paenibacillus sp. KQZ6P-2]|uniref:DUF2759 domain-containing protein n=1 Tax=Paenibacillus mangrovi TaxID=2931978 RepID=A0A9X2B5H4_9BACL|nr:hypothetical protein [Paenibacillus mangrovi]MCJ8012692.1 hypothetical protein [Paenibacillus mangrovi]